MDKLLKAIKDKLDSPQGMEYALYLLTPRGYLNWCAGKELVMNDIKAGLLALFYDMELIGA